MGKKDKSRKKTKFSTILTPEQKAKFKEFGEPDLTQNWLEIFTDDIINDLFTIMKSCSDNQRKADYICEELESYGFSAVGLGTNIITMANPYYPGVVFKIALDDYGIADNFNDCVLVNYVPRYNRVFARDPSAMISVQERLVIPTQEQMDLFMPRILQILKEMSKYFLIADLSPDMFLNYGVTRDGDFRFIDASDLYPLSQMKKEPRCNRITGEHKHTGDFKYCEGKLKYTPDFKYLVCEKCGKEFMPLEFRPRKDVEKLSKILSDGLTAEEREALETDELKVICQRNGEEFGDPTIATPRKIFVDHPEEDDDDDGNDLDDSEIALPEESDDKSGPREVYVSDDDEEDEEEERDDDGFQQLRPREVQLPMSSDPNEEQGETVDSPEAAEPVNVDKGDTDALNVESTAAGISNDASHQETSTEAPEEVEQTSLGIMDSINPDEMEDTSAFVALMGYIKKSNDPKDQSIYKGFLMFMRKAMNNAVRDYRNEQMEAQEDSPAEEADNAKFAQTYCKKLFESTNPMDQKVLQEICDMYDLKSDVENDSDNKNNTGESDPISPLIPHIHYRVENDDGNEDSDILPGIFLTIYGDYEDAYAESGLPIYISVDGGTTLCLAVHAHEIKALLDAGVTEAYAEQALMTSRHNSSSDDAEEEEETEE
jgi:midasin, putative